MGFSDPVLSVGCGLCPRRRGDQDLQPRIRHVCCWASILVVLVNSLICQILAVFCGTATWIKLIDKAVLSIDLLQE